MLFFHKVKRKSVYFQEVTREFGHVFDPNSSPPFPPPPNPRLDIRPQPNYLVRTLLASIYHHPIRCRSTTASQIFHKRTSQANPLMTQLTKFLLLAGSHEIGKSPCYLLTNWGGAHYVVCRLTNWSDILFIPPCKKPAMKVTISCSNLSVATLVLCVAFLFDQAALAQTDTPDCEQCYCVADNTPYGSTNCIAGNDCNGYSFVAECTQNYYLKYLLTCTGESSCAECLSCAYLTDDNGDVIWSHHNSCAVNDCQGVSTPVQLTANATYKLWACLRYCNYPSTSSCEDCVARAYVYRDWSDCSTIPACNP